MQNVVSDHSAWWCVE